jgi:sortase (surface protein transpeptidase)
MRTPDSPDDSGHTLADGLRNPTRWWLASVILLLVGAGSFTFGRLGPQAPQSSLAVATRSLTSQPPVVAAPSTSTPTPADTPAATPAPTDTPTPADVPATAAPPAASSVAAPAAKPPVIQSVPKSARRSATRAAASPLRRSTPVALRIPALGVSVPLTYTLGLNADRTIEVPSSNHGPGWFRLGPAPGQIGSAVILGHVDSRRGPEAFYHLRSLKAGNQVNVTLADGRVAHFVVTRVRSYLKTQFPTQQVYVSHGFSALQLVTCGGQFNQASGHYLSNTVVYTSLVSTT